MNGKLFFELGQGQSEQVKLILEKNGFKKISIMKDYENIDRIISRTLAGDASNREEKELKDWILEEDAHYLEYKIIQESTLKGFKERKLLNTDDTFEKVWEVEETQKKVSHYKIGFSVFKMIAVSAAGLALILLSVFSYRQLVIKQEISQIDGQPVMIEKYSPIGQISKVFLPDGSLVRFHWVRCPHDFPILGNGALAFEYSDHDRATRHELD